MPKKTTSVKTPILDRIKPVAEHPRYLAALIYGRSGTGKTALASTFPKPILLVDIRERGTDTVAKVEGLDVFEAQVWDDLEQVYWFLASGTSKYKTVVLDQITQLQDLVMAKHRADEGMDPDEILAKRDWGQISGLTKTWLLNFKDLIDRGLHVVLIAHQREDDAEGEGEGQLTPSIGPRLMPSVSSAITGAAGLIGNTFIRERFLGTERTRVLEYCLRIGPHASYITKVRHSVDITTPDVVVNPTYEKLCAVIRGEKSQPRRRSK